MTRNASRLRSSTPGSVVFPRPLRLLGLQSGRLPENARSRAHKIYGYNLPSRRLQNLPVSMVLACAHRFVILSLRCQTWYQMSLGVKDSDTASLYDSTRTDPQYPMRIVR